MVEPAVDSKAAHGSGVLGDMPQVRRKGGTDHTSSSTTYQPHSRSKEPDCNTGRRVRSKKLLTDTIRPDKVYNDFHKVSPLVDANTSISLEKI